MTPRFRRLLGLELRETLRQPLTWAVCALLFGAMLVGAANGANRVSRERQVLQAVAAEQAGAVESAKAAARRYARPSDLKVDYHRDPTDAFGYMNYFLVTHAVKPPLPLAALAAGQSDLQPFQIRTDFNSTFPDAAYDPGGAHGLKLGAFDLAFVLVHLVPLGLIALGAGRLAGEQDSGVLRLIAAQPIAPRTVALAKFGALALVAAAAVVGGAFFALLAVGGAPPTPALGLTAVVLALWVVFWISLSALAATLWRGAVTSTAVLVLVWTLLSILAPTAAAALVQAVHPAPSRVAYVDASRQAMDRFYAAETEVHAAWLARHPRFLSDQAVKSPEVKRFARDAFYRDALSPRHQAVVDHHRAVLAMSDRLRLLSPTMALDGALQTAAGTDARRHLGFIAAADAYSERLRRWFEPLALRNAHAPERSCPECPGRLNFTRYDAVPAFAPTVDEAPGSRALAWAGLHLLLASTAAAAWAFARLGRWPLVS